MKKAPWTRAFPKQVHQLERAERQWITRRVKPLARVTRIRPRSKRETQRMRQYVKQSRQWLRGKFCAVFPVMPATAVHHSRGRLGPLLFDERFWVPVSFEGHRWIDEHRDEARAKGLLAKRGDWHRIP